MDEKLNQKVGGCWFFGVSSIFTKLPGREPTKNDGGR